LIGDISFGEYYHFPISDWLMIAFIKTGRIAHAIMDINAAYWTLKH